MRPKKNLIASTTLDIMRGQGMKYLHAISDARQGVEGDLERIQRQIKRYNETVGTPTKRNQLPDATLTVEPYRKIPGTFRGGIRRKGQHDIGCPSLKSGAFRAVGHADDPRVRRASRESGIGMCDMTCRRVSEGVLTPDVG